MENEQGRLAFSQLRGVLEQEQIDQLLFAIVSVMMTDIHVMQSEASGRYVDENSIAKYSDKVVDDAFALLRNNGIKI